MNTHDKAGAGTSLFAVESVAAQKSCGNDSILRTRGQHAGDPRLCPGVLWRVVVGRTSLISSSPPGQS